MTDFQEFTFLSSDGHTRLHGAQWTPADREPLPFYRSPTA